ncbi:MAG: hypothetical protein P1V97_02715 [Planctomycetota bacterium]|nr:hypothetical protein [Planctomycetota bacterium]
MVTARFSGNLSVRCSRCQRSHTVSIEHAGHDLRCHCRATITVPSYEHCDRCKSPCKETKLYWFQALCPYCHRLIDKAHKDCWGWRLALMVAAATSSALWYTLSMKHDPLLISQSLSFFELYGLAFVVGFIGLAPVFVFLFLAKDAFLKVKVPLLDDEDVVAYSFNKENPGYYKRKRISQRRRSFLAMTDRFAERAPKEKAERIRRIARMVQLALFIPIMTVFLLFYWAFTTNLLWS